MRDETGDAWNGRSLEWATASPPPAFNFAVLPNLQGAEPYWEIKRRAIELVREFLEAFVDTSIDECRRRDPKGLYARADQGLIRNFTGVSAPYEAPENPELHLDTGEANAEELAERVVEELRRRAIIA